MGRLKVQILEAIKKIRRGNKRPHTKYIFKLLAMDPATNITMRDNKEKIQALIQTSII